MIEIPCFYDCTINMINDKLNEKNLSKQDIDLINEFRNEIKNTTDSTELKLVISKFCDKNPRLDILLFNKNNKPNNSINNLNKYNSQCTNGYSRPFFINTTIFTPNNNPIKLPNQMTSIHASLYGFM